MAKPLNLKLLTLLCANTLLLACSEPQSQSTSMVTADQALTSQELSDQSANTFQRAGHGARDGEWQAYGGDEGSTKYTALDGINIENVADLEVVWRRPALDQHYLDINPNQRYTTNWNAAPLVINGVGYVTNGVGLVEAFHPGTGETLWVQEPPGGAEGLPGASTRGAAYWSEGDEQRL
ncbi:MAG: hypothetical protein VXZ01_08605, partial [Pseudomonadota bacterium]|nr:hypothetical protein [Pseudomonadota bacterium]